MQIAITNRGSNQIQPEIIKQMNTAQRSIWVAVAWFIDREIKNSYTLQMLTTYFLVCLYFEHLLVYQYS
jgi:hypothetical protein